MWYERPEVSIAQVGSIQAESLIDFESRWDFSCRIDVSAMQWSFAEVLVLKRETHWFHTQWIFVHFAANWITF